MFSAVRASSEGVQNGDSSWTTPALWVVVGCICAAALAFMWYAAVHEPATMDELAHIPSGYGYVHNLDYRLNPEHPPLLKALAALPLLLVHPHFPTESTSWTTDVNGQWNMGVEFLYYSGNNPDVIVRVARIAPMLLTLLLIVFIYYWCSKFMGGAWALLPTLLFAFSPTVLAHGHYVTTDVAAAFGVLLATHFFLKALREPSVRNVIFAGLALGIAELMKFSAILLLPCFGLLACIHFFLAAKGVHGKYFWRLALRRLWNLVLVVIVAYVLVVYPVYFLFTVNYPISKQVSDTQVILTSLIGGATAQSGSGCSELLSCLSRMDVWMAGQTLMRPFGHYLLGLLMVIQRASGGNTAYFLGKVTASGSHLYFPIVYALKESLPALIIVLLALAATIGRMARRVARRESRAATIAYLEAHFTEFALALFAGIYWFYSIRSTLNIGVRHLMPIVPIMYILAAAFWRRWVLGFRLSLKGGTLRAVWEVVRSVFAASLKMSLLLVLVGWVLIETFVTAPNFLPYFNQLGGGTWGGYRYVTDSNYDWGQDLLRLRDFVDAHPEIDRIAVDYFGGGLPSYYLGYRDANWSSRFGNPADQDIHWFAVSATFLQNSIQPAAPGFLRSPDSTYSWLTALRPAPPGSGTIPPPDYRAGPSIFIYHL